MFFCIPDDLNQYLRKPLPYTIERIIAKKFISADRLSTALFKSLVYDEQPVERDLPPTEEEKWLKKIRKDAISEYTIGGLISESFSLWLKSPKKEVLNYSLEHLFFRWID